MISETKGISLFKEHLESGKYFLTHVRKSGYTFLCHSVGKTIKSGPKKDQFELKGVVVIQVPKSGYNKKHYRTRLITAKQADQTLDILDDMIRLEKRSKRNNFL